jgi:prophage regulatory protein
LELSAFVNRGLLGDRMTTTIVHVAPAALDRESSAAYCALSVSTFERLVREKSAPQPRQFAGRRVGWLRAELDEWLLARPVSSLLPPPNTSAKRARRGAA